MVTNPPDRRRRRPLSTAVVLTCAVGLSLSVAPAAPAGAAPAEPVAGQRSLLVAREAASPVVVPTPQSMAVSGQALRVPARAVIVAGAGTDVPARNLLTRLLRQHGAGTVEVVADADDVRPRANQLVVLLGAGDRSDIDAALGRTAVPDKAEGYALRVLNSALSTGVVIGGRDGAGQFYGVQTLRQLFQRSGERWTIAPATVTDWPRMSLRGTIEGFYGSPWTNAERLHQLRFQGDVKANSYVYSPKDDPYLRAEWRDPYPAAELATIQRLVREAEANHVAFTYALSPGVSICFSSAADRRALLDKLNSVYDIGVRSFSIPFDDISYTRWNCENDQAAYGGPGAQQAGIAQVSLLNAVVNDFVKAKGDVAPLQTVPTEYADISDSPYKTEIRERLDPSVIMQWTGIETVPPAVSNANAEAIEKIWGRKTFLWDNYPVNDYGESAGRLLLAPYDKRERGLADHLQGIVANPMNQQAASILAVYGMADFTWNDLAYDPQRTWRQAMLYVAGDDRTAAAAIGVFADLEHAAPIFGPSLWQEQAPVLKAKLAAFETDWAANRKAKAIRELRAYALRIKDAPATIRGSRTTDRAFVSDASRWLTATQLWGSAMVTQLDALEASRRGEQTRAAALTRRADALVGRAAAVRSVAGENRWGFDGVVPILVGDGVLDVGIARLKTLTG